MKLFSDGDNIIIADLGSDPFIYVFEKPTITRLDIEQSRNLIDVTTCDSRSREFTSGISSYNVFLDFVGGGKINVISDTHPLEILFADTPVIDLIKLVNLKIKRRKNA